MKDEKLERILILPDTHAPYHHKQSWKLVMKVAQAFEWHTCVLLGDFFDGYAVSRYTKHPNKIASLRKEIALGRKQCLDPLSALPFKKKKVVLGNHEQRVPDYLAQKAPELYEEIMDGDVFGFEAGKWEVTDYRQHTRVGKVIFTHDVAATGALAVLNAVQDNVVTGHDHQMNYVVKGTALGVVHVSATFGWLGDIKHAEYMHSLKARRQWAHGFGYGYRRKNGWMYLTPVPIVKGTCVVEGRLFKA